MNSIVLALIGGLLIGVSAWVLLGFNGRIAGISGILEGLFDANSERGWRVAFILGMLIGGVILLLVRPESFGLASDRSLLATGVAGLLVGFGTRLGSGCTSGHGICGLPRLSIRSLVAVLTFMLSGAVTVYVVNHVIGGF